MEGYALDELILFNNWPTFLDIQAAAFVLSPKAPKTVAEDPPTEAATEERAARKI